MRSVWVIIIGVVAGMGVYVHALSEPLSQNEELQQAVSRMHANGMTKYESYDDFRSFDILTRQEAAKFFTEFSINILYKDIDQNKFCGFDDIDQADPSLKNHIISSCLLGIFQGTAGYFNPEEPLTKAQALAVLIRAMEGHKNEETLPWWINYYRAAHELGLTSEPDPYALDRPLLRYEMALLIYRAGTDNPESSIQITNNNDPSNETGTQEVVKVDELIKTGGGE